ncbi:Signal transduction histidine-protein kinase BarA [compost metagenome]
MNGVMTMADLLIETDLTQEQKEYAETIRKSGQTLLKMINQILELSKMETNAMELEYETFELSHCIGETLDLFTRECRKKSLDIEVWVDSNVPLTLSGDCSRIRQILINLIGNAVKFTESGRIDIEVRQISEDESSIELEFIVKDTGIGIQEKDIGALFQPFSQLDSATNRKYEGTGLGLVISKHLVELMSGSIRIKPNEGAGVSFIFTIHVHRAL